MADRHGLLSLPRDVLVMLPNYLHCIEDYMNLSSTCRSLRVCMSTASPDTILRLAAAQTRIFFRPSPFFLVAATARQLGEWARESDANEAQLALSAQEGMDGLLELAVEHCGLTMERIRELHLMRFSTMNPVTDIIDQCVGTQWYETPNFWDGGVDDAYTVDAEPSETLFHLAVYGELFGPDLEAYLDGDASRRTLSVDTRMEFVKYCIPDFATTCAQWYEYEEDPRRAIKPVGPYANGERLNSAHNHNIALTWVLRSSRWRPHWKAIRSLAGPDFDENFRDGWWFDEDDTGNWRQRLWENAMVCQGLNGLRMISPGLGDGERDEWVARIREWREKIEKLPKEDKPVKVIRQATHSWPYLLGDLRIAASGYVVGS